MNAPVSMNPRKSFQLVLVDTSDGGSLDYMDVPDGCIVLAYSDDGTKCEIVEPFDPPQVTLQCSDIPRPQGGDVLGPHAPARRWGVADLSTNPTRSDRRVHAAYDSMEVVRYDRSGKWYLEPTIDTLPRQHVGIEDAVLNAVWGLDQAHGEVYHGLPGGSTFDRKVRAARERRFS